MERALLSTVFVPSVTDTLMRTPPDGIELEYVAEFVEFGPEKTEYNIPEFRLTLQVYVTDVPKPVIEPDVSVPRFSPAQTSVE
jgi:hypothetical protein